MLNGYGDFNISFSSAYLCGPNPTTNGDSLYHLHNGTFIIKEFNSTSNHASYIGGCGGAIINSEQDSFISFMTIALGTDHNMFEIWSSLNQNIFYSNFVRNTINTNMFWMPDTAVTLKSCSFYGNGNLAIVGTLDFIGCFGDFSRTGITLTATTLQNVIGFHNNCNIASEDPTGFHSITNINIWYIFVSMFINCF